MGLIISYKGRGSIFYLNLNLFSMDTRLGLQSTTVSQTIPLALYCCDYVTECDYVIE